MEIETIIHEKFTVSGIAYLNVNGIFMFAGFIREGCKFVLLPELFPSQTETGGTLITQIDNVVLKYVIQPDFEGNPSVYIMPCVDLQAADGSIQATPMRLTDFSYTILNDNPELYNWFLNQLPAQISYLNFSYTEYINNGGNYNEVLQHQTIEELLQNNLVITGLNGLTLNANKIEYRQVTQVVEAEQDQPTDTTETTMGAQTTESESEEENGNTTDFSDVETKAVDFNGAETRVLKDGNTIVGLEYLKRPVPDNGEPINFQEGLFIPRNTNVDTISTLELMNTMCTCKGVPISKSMLKSSMDDVLERQIILYNNILKPFFQTDYIDFSSRTQNSQHIGNLCCKYFEKLINKSKHLLKNDRVSFTEPEITKYKDRLQVMISAEEYTLGITPSEANEWLKILNTILEYKSLVATESQFKDLKIITTTVCPDNPETAKKKKLLWATPDINDEDIMWVHPTIMPTNTFRYSTSEPNLQGKCPTVKECIKAPKGYSIFSIDISAQDVYPLICEIMDNKRIMEKTQLYGDCYMAILDERGYERTKENKNACKVPVLSVINGKAKRTTENDAIEGGYDVDMVLSIYDFINNEPGYQRVKDAATLESRKSQSFRQGLFGSKREIRREIKRKGGADSGYMSGNELISAIYRKILNGPFQITSAEIFTISYMTMMYDLIYEKTKGISLREVCPLLPVHDEVIGIVKDDFDADGNNIYTEVIRHYMLPHVETWIRMSGKLIISRHYEHK